MEQKVTLPRIALGRRDIPDPHSPLGAHGIGEIGITSVGAAVANAVYNATGKRIRELPITLDKLCNPPSPYAHTDFVPPLANEPRPLRFPSFFGNLWRGGRLAMMERNQPEWAQLFAAKMEAVRECHIDEPLPRAIVAKRRALKDRERKLVRGSKLASPKR